MSSNTDNFRDKYYVSYCTLLKRKYFHLITSEILEYKQYYFNSMRQQDTNVTSNRQE